MADDTRALASTGRASDLNSTSAEDLAGARSSPDPLRRRLADFLQQEGYPCRMARMVTAQECMTIVEYETMRSKESIKALARDLRRFIVTPAAGPYRSFAAGFREMAMSELAFEHLLWGVLRQLHELDVDEWDPTVSSEPDDPKFAFSFAGKAHFVVGLHPGASRPARRFEQPLLIFNPHDQFERLREEGNFKRVRNVTRERDSLFAGSINPMLSDFGKASEARQYSGRSVSSEWVCPFDANGSQSV